MDLVLQGIPGVVCYLDDILVTGKTDEDHLRILEMVLQRLQEHGVRLRQDKCRFFQQSVEYLGHWVDADGIHTSQTKIEAITGAPPPTNVSQLCSFGSNQILWETTWQQPGPTWHHGYTH